jgi:hypothetical protein
MMLRSNALVTAIAMLALAACGGQAEGDDDLVIEDTESALSGVESTNDADEDDVARGDDGCRDGDRDAHHHHRRHWFKVLDRLDGTKDKAITIASLPDGLPERLLLRLARIDANSDGVVTKKEAKRALRRHRHRDLDRDREERDDD